MSRLEAGSACPRPLGMLRSSAAVFVLLAVPARAATGPTVTVGGIDVQPVSVLNPSEIHDHWWFWLIIGIIALFVIVALYFTWRGFRQWKLHKQREQQCQAAEGEPEKDDQEEQPAKEASPAGPGDVEMGRVTAVPLTAATGGQQPPQTGLTAEQRWAALQADPSWLADRERRTAVHPRRHAW